VYVFVYGPAVMPVTGRGFGGDAEKVSAVQADILSASGAVFDADGHLIFSLQRFAQRFQQFKKLNVHGISLLAAQEPVAFGKLLTDH
jgi:hypothetical protein